MHGATTTPGLLIYGAGDKHKAKRGYNCSQECRAVSGLVTRIMISEPVVWVSTCVLKMAFQGLGVYRGFITFCFDPKAPTKTLFSMDGRHIIVVNKGLCAKEILFGQLADVTPNLVF